MKKKFIMGVLVVNLGTPSAPTAREVRSYLKEFLSDPCVIRLPSILRQLLLHTVILPFRPYRSASAYKKIWSSEGSPLKVHSEGFVKSLGTYLGASYRVVLAMRYGNPSIESAYRELEACRSIIVLPLFPQYSSVTTESIFKKMDDVSKTVKTIPHFFDNEFYIQSLAVRIQETLAMNPVDFLLFSYHGIPERYLENNDCRMDRCYQIQPCRNERDSCYRSQCYQTSDRVAERLNLLPTQFGVSFQSRLGRSKWIGPCTVKTLDSLLVQGVKRIAIVCPSFVTDCLETLEEIGIRAKERWLLKGGHSFLLIPALNSHPVWIQSASQIIQNALVESEQS